MQRRRSVPFVEQDLRNLGVRVTPFLRKLSVLVVFKMKLWVRRTRLHMKLRAAQSHYDIALRARCGRQLFAIFRQRVKAVQAWRHSAATAAFRQWRSTVNENLFRQEAACGKLQAVSLGVVASRCFITWSLYSRLVEAIQRRPSANATHLEALARGWPMTARFEVYRGRAVTVEFFVNLAVEKASSFREVHLLRHALVQWQLYRRVRLSSRADTTKALAWRSNRLLRGALREWILARRLALWIQSKRRSSLVSVFSLWLPQAKRGARDRRCVQLLALQHIGNGKRSVFERWKRRWYAEATLTSNAVARIARDSRLINCWSVFALLAGHFRQLHGPEDLNAQWLGSCGVQAKCFLKWKTFVGWTRLVHNKFGSVPCTLSVTLVDLTLGVPSLSDAARWLLLGGSRIGQARIESLLESHGDEMIVSARAVKELNPTLLLQSTASVLPSVDWTAPVTRWRPALQPELCTPSPVFLSRGDVLAARRATEIRAISGLNCRFAAAALAGSQASSLGFLPSAVTFNMEMFDRKRRRRRKSTRTSEVAEPQVATEPPDGAVTVAALATPSLHTDCVPVFAGQHVIAVSAASVSTEQDKPELFPRSASVDSMDRARSPLAVDAFSQPHVALEAVFVVQQCDDLSHSHPPPEANPPVDVEALPVRPSDVVVLNDALQEDEEQYVNEGAREAMQSFEAAELSVARTTSPSPTVTVVEVDCDRPASPEPKVVEDDSDDVLATLTCGVRSIQLFAFNAARNSVPTSSKPTKAPPRVSFAAIGGRSLCSPVVAAGFPARVLKRSRK